MTEKKAFNKNLIYLLIILFLGGLLRFSKLSFQSPWNDELYSVTATSKSSLMRVLKDNQKDVHPPFYNILIYFWQKLYGNSIFSLRFLSAIFGTLAILAIFFLGKTLYSEKEGLISALILSISYFGIYYSQEARSYSLLLLLSICSYLFFVKIVMHLNDLEKMKKVYLYILYLLTTTILIYTHYFGILVLVSQFLFIFCIFIYNKEKNILKIIFFHFIIGFLYIPQIMIMKYAWNMEKFWIPKPNFDFFIFYLNDFWGKNEALFIISLTFILFFIFFKREDDESKKRQDILKVLLISGWYIIPLFLAFLRSIFSTPILTSRNAVIVMPPVILMMSKGITNLKKEAVIIALTITVFVSGLCSLFITNDYYHKITKEQFREVADVVMQQKTITDNSIIVTSSHKTNFFEYFFKQAGSPYKVAGVFEKGEDIGDLDRLIKNSNKKYLWLLAGHRYPSRELLKYLDNNYRMIGQDKYIGSSYFIFQLK